MLFYNKHMSTAKNKYILTSLNHALIILDLLSVRTNLGVTEISRITGYDKASVYKMLYTLQHRGYVVKNDNAQYNISEKLAGTLKPRERENIGMIAAPYMNNLRDITEETVLLGVLNTNGRVVLMAKEEGIHNDSIKIRLGYELDSYSNALGKMLLSNLDDPFREALMKVVSIYPHTENTITDPEELNKQLAEYTGKDYVIQFDENYPNHSDVSSPVYDADGRVVAGLSIACSTDKMKAHQEFFTQQLIHYAKSISAAMGYRG